MVTDVANGVIEDGEGWILPLAGRPVTRLLFDYRIALQIGEREPFCTIALSCPLKLTISGCEHEIDPETRSRAVLTPALELFAKTVKSARADHSGLLCIEFEDGDRLTAPPDAGGNYESWEARGGDPAGGTFWQLICLPSGGLAVW